ncbi:septal ring lytic transglycosylase RlpA family protein [Burkholderiaceae bacterium UC74_6]
MLRLVLVAIFALLLTACGTPKAPGSRPAPMPAGRDGAEANPPSNLQSVPDAAPKLENIRKGGPNKPYEVDGTSYTPLTGDAPLVERGLASWYGKKFHGRPTSSGEIYDMYAMTAAHATMPIPSYARVRNPANGREVIVRINDRGPFHAGRIIDLSYTAALKLDVLRGVAPVEVERITYDDIRTGAWMRGRKDEQALPAPPVYAATEGANAPQRETTATMAGDVSLQPAPVPFPTPPAAPKTASPGFWLQFGAYAKLDGAEQERSRLADSADWLAPLLAIFKDRNLNRLQAGPYATQADARAAAARLREAMGLNVLIVERK